eukprot:gene4958-3549_t
MFPYPSGAGLHVGHPEGYTATDIMSRFWRMQGYDVLHPMGWDAFGLPAEQHAINTGTHPAVTTYENIATFKRQLKSLGFSYDWSRELSTTDDHYVRWTQWIFLQLFKKGLAFQSEVSVNWCPALGTVLANEEVINGKSERGDHPVIRQPLRQWVLKITDYADKLEEGLKDMEWPEGTLSAQKQWIGRSEGASIKFSIAGVENQSIEVFTTRPDTLMGVTYVVLAPEHPFVDQLTTVEQRAAVDAYRREAASKSDLERTAIGKDQGKSGVALGSFVVHPLTQERVPIWIADYVLAGYGTGAVMAWAGSCWYYLRFTDPTNTKEIFSREAASWLPVDLYVGGQEHAVLHLLYARFWHKVLFDIGVVDHPEPFKKLVHQGMILGGDGEKMSKSRGNVINPDDIVHEYGADALRLYEMFMGPLEATKPWQSNQLMGVVRFRDRVFSLIQPGRLTTQAPQGEVLVEMHKTIKKVTHDIEKMSFNTAISAMMIFANKLSSLGPQQVPQQAVESLVLLLSPFAPHVAEEMWSLMGHQQSLAHEQWPTFDAKLAEDAVVKIAVQINGKVRATIEVAKDIDEATVIRHAMEQGNVAKFTQDKQIKKTIYVPGRIVNIIV